MRTNTDTLDKYFRPCLLIGNAAKNSRRVCINYFKYVHRVYVHTFTYVGVVHLVYVLVD